jgi:hypothetical protein
MLQGDLLSCGFPQATADEMSKRSNNRPLQALISLVRSDKESLRQRRAMQITALVAAAGPVRRIGRRNHIPFTLELCNLRKYELQPGEQTLDFGQCNGRDWLAEARSQSGFE